MPTDNERLDRIEQILEITLTLGQQFREDLIQIDQMTKRFCYYPIRGESYPIC
jgi:hypothetical protein